MSAGEFAAEYAERLKKAVVPNEAYEARRQLEERIRRELAAETNAWFAQSNISERHKRRVPDRSGPWGAALAKCEAALGTGFLLAIVGEHGGGKTQMGAELIKLASRERHMPCLFRSATEIFMIIKDTFHPNSKRGSMDIMMELRKPGLLVIDEVSKRGETDWESTILFEIINQRYNDMKDTFLTSNLSVSDFRACVGRAVVSRLNESGGLIEVNWQSFRQ